MENIELGSFLNLPKSAKYQEHHEKLQVFGIHQQSKTWSIVSYPVPILDSYYENKTISLFNKEFHHQVLQVVTSFGPMTVTFENGFLVTSIWGIMSDHELKKLAVELQVL